MTVHVEVPVVSTVDWAIYTLNFRKICQGSTVVSDRGEIQWDLKDKTGSQVANGLYYFRVEVKGPKPLVRTLKVLVVR